MYPDQLRIFRPILRRVEYLPLFIPIFEQMPEPGEPQTMLWAVIISLGVRVSVMQPVSAAEAYRIAEERAAKQSERELERAAGLERPVGEVTMQSHAEREQHQQIEHAERDPILPRRFDEWQREGRQMEQEDAGSRDQPLPSALC